ncbi:hypothetical protein GJAV_G00271160 [Gymnothorax javanicus]|nr:hypothetical protein GJAV_G00271160 [Gymnothorax javanicus]
MDHTSVNRQFHHRVTFWRTAMGERSLIGCWGYFFLMKRGAFDDSRKLLHAFCQRIISSALCHAVVCCRRASPLTAGTGL